MRGSRGIGSQERMFYGSVSSPRRDATIRLREVITWIDNWKHAVMKDGPWTIVWEERTAFWDWMRWLREMGSKAMKWIWLSVVCTFPLQFHEMGYLLIVWNRIVTKHIFTKYTDSERELLHSVDSSCLPYETVHFPSSHVPSPSNSQHLPPNRFLLLSSCINPY